MIHCVINKTTKCDQHTLSLDKVEAVEKIMVKKSKNDSLISTIELGRTIKRRRQDLELSLRAVADKTGVSASTLSRIENGTGKPVADNIARLSSWLDMPVDRVMKKRDNNKAIDRVVYYPHEETPEIVKAHLRADKNLSPETANALSELFRVAYLQFSGSEKKK